MVALFALIAAQAIPVMRVPPPTTPAPSLQIQPQVSATILPDLVVKDVRIEGDTTLHVLVANDGTTDSPPQIAMYVRALGNSIAVGSPRGGAAQWLIPQLKAGTSRWIRVPALGAPRADGLPQDDVVSLADLSSFVVYVDPYVIEATSMWRATNVAQGDPSLCKTSPEDRIKRGCVPESNEDNNTLSMDKTAIQAWNPHLGIRRP